MYPIILYLHYSVLYIYYICIFYDTDRGGILLRIYMVPPGVPAWPVPGVCMRWLSYLRRLRGPGLGLLLGLFLEILPLL